MTQDEYTDWLLDVRNNPYRILLVELSHVAGTVRIASRAWMSDSNLAYDPWLTEVPDTEESLTSFGGIGEVTAVNLDSSVDWLSYLWHGHPAKIKHGDERWPVNDFQQIATTVIDGCEFVGGYEYRFTLMDSGNKLDRPLVTTDTSKAHNVQAAILYIEGIIDMSVSMVNVSSAKLGWSLAYDLTTQSTAGDVLRDIATSIGGYLRVDQIGNIEIVIPKSESVTTITESQISITGLDMTENISPYTTVVVIKDDDTEVSEDTGIDTGELAREIRTNTYLSSTSDAEDLRDELLTYYANTHGVWNIDLLDIVDILKVGDIVTVDHEKLNNSGMIRYINRSPLTNESIIEVVV